ncbi:MAG: Rieske (2Fe-2S) protein [Alphaproteobacteria bacterium]|nr:Rieske (2Fe-2S) protein [Alphaproteobacteria bacterium]MCY4320669.1 Rieske (2Fe-2S) protein [Alphaproteobacteria bacterium]
MSTESAGEARDCAATAMKSLTRRCMVGRVVVGGALLTTGVVAGLPGSAEAAKPRKPDRMFTQPGDRLQLIKGEAQGEALRPDMLTTGARPVEVFPLDPASGVLRRRNRLNRILALRLDPAEMDDQTRARSAEGVLAFSALCTHRACTIKSWMAEERHLRCHCHLSEFAALSGGSVRGGPARRQLPMVPLGLDGEGFIVALDGFTRKPGPAKT